MGNRLHIEAIQVLNRLENRRMTLNQRFDMSLLVAPLRYITYGVGGRACIQSVNQWMYLGHSLACQPVLECLTVNIGPRALMHKPKTIMDYMQRILG